ncbi:MAG TPA: LacI family transcriptional regulator [Clostridiales bacterium]|nr:LacI family transcriptional regulator [Clostridiales bacterium]
MSVTIRDVAKKAKVSLGTVSRYLNGYKLRESNRIRIEEAIRELGFQENLIAKGLKTNRSMTIGVVLASLTDLFATSVITAAERILAQDNYSIVVCDFESSQSKLEQKLRFLKARSVDGLILFPGSCTSSDALREYLEDEIPVVIVNDDMPDIKTDKVVIDNSGASFRAVEWLIHQNHRDIAIINGDQNTYTGRERYKGYLEALQTYNIEPREEYITYGYFSNRGGYEAAKKLLALEHPPTAIYTANYYMTFGAIIAINEAKIRIPDDISFIGFDHFELSDVINPPLTVVEQPTDRLGELAAKLVLRRVKGDYEGFPARLSVNTRMIIKESVKRL